MTVTLAVRNSPTMEVTLEWERPGFCARVYEKWGGEWHQTHESRRYSDKRSAARSYSYFVRKYFKEREE